MAAPVNLILPSASGDTYLPEGTITGTEGTWDSGSTTQTRWIVYDNKLGANPETIETDSATHAIQADEVGKYYRFAVDRTNGEGTTTAYSDYLGPVTSHANYCSCRFVGMQIGF